MFPQCKIIFLSSHSRGAALTALSGLALISDFELPVVIDLADIVYSSDIDLEKLFAANDSLGGIALTFFSSSPQYSYLSFSSHGDFIAAAEKKVISDHASAGTYFFKNPSTLIKAIAHSIDKTSHCI